VRPDRRRRQPPPRRNPPPHEGTPAWRAEWVAGLLRDRLPSERKPPSPTAMATGEKRPHLVERSWARSCTKRTGTPLIASHSPRRDAISQDKPRPHAHKAIAGSRTAEPPESAGVREHPSSRVGTRDDPFRIAPSRGRLTHRIATWCSVAPFPVRWRLGYCHRGRVVSRGLSPSGPRNLWRVSTPGPGVCDFTRGGAPSRNGGLGGRVQPHHPVVTKRRHHPVVAEQSDGRWVVKCAECRRGIESVPIGIDTPVSTVYMAELLRVNHAGTRAIPNAPKSLVRTWTSKSLPASSESELPESRQSA
jgi:hypothetical protein